MALNPQFPNYANGPAGTEVIGWTVVGGQPLYRLPVAYVDTGFGAAFVCEGSTVEAPTFPEGVYAPDPKIESAGVISGTPEVGEILSFAPGNVTGTAPITVQYNWIRYNPGGTSLIIGTGLNYTVQIADAGYALVVQTVASNSLGTVGTQTVPYGPCTAPGPIITDPGTLTVDTVSTVGAGSGSVLSVTLDNGGSDYVYLLGAPDVTITGDGTGATATATLAEEGPIIATNASAGTGTKGTSGTITYSGEGSETDIVLNWSVGGLGEGTGPITVTLVDGGSGWTQANATAVEQLSYGTRVVTGPAWTIAPNIGLFVGVPVASLTLVSGGSGYTTANVTITPVAGDTYGNGALGSATVGAATCPVPGEVIRFSGATIFSQTSNYTTYTTWVNADDPSEVWQLGGDEFVIPDSAVGDRVAVNTAVFGAGGTASAQTAAIAICGEIALVSPSKISVRDPLYVGDGLVGTPAVFDSYGEVTRTFQFLDVTDPNNPIPVGYPDATNYAVTNEDFGKSFAFRTIGTIGTLSETSISATMGPADGYLDVVTKPTISYPGDIAYPGIPVTGVPGTFNGVPPVTSVSNRFYRNDGTPTVPTWTPIGAAEATTFILTEDEVGKQVAYGSAAVSPLYPGGLLSLSNPITPTHILTFTTQGGYLNITVPGAVPKVGDQVQMVFPESDPQNTEYGGAVPITGRFWNESRIGTSANPYTIPSAWYGRRAYAEYTATYEGNKYVQTTTSFVVGGTAPTIGAGGEITSDSTRVPFQPGTNAVFTPPAYTEGVPSPTTASWTWYSVVPGGTRTALQNGGTTLPINATLVNKTLEVDFTVSNVVGSDKETITAPVPIPPPTVFFTSIGQLTAPTTFTKDQYNTSQLVGTYSSSTATDGGTDPITITKEFLLCDALGNPLASGIKSTDNKPSAGSVTFNNACVNSSFGSVKAPPADPKQFTPTPASGNYVVIKWTATNPKTGSTATALSNIVGPLTDPSFKYGGITPWGFRYVKRDPNYSLYDCYITLPTFNNGGACQVSSIEVRTSGNQFYPDGKVLGTGSTTFEATESELFGAFGGATVTVNVTGPLGTFTAVRVLIAD